MNHFYTNLKLMLVALFAFMGVNVWADTETINFASQNFENAEKVSAVKGTNVQAVFADGSTATAYYTTGSAVRIYGGGSVTIEGVSGQTITGAVLTFSATNNAPSGTAYSLDEGKVSIDGTTVTWSGEAESFTLERPSGSGHWRLQKVEVTYSASTATVAKPVITPATSTVFGDQTVTITCATEGAKIYYLKTVEFEEGSQMQKAYEEYTSPLTINYDNGSIFGKATKATISAYAVIPATSDAAEQTSETVEVTLTWATVYTSIAEANAAATETRTDAGIQADNWLVTYVNGQYTYLTDGVAGLLLYGNDLGLEQGQKVSGLIKGKLFSYNGLPEVASPNVDELEVMSEGNEVAPIVVAASKLQEEKTKWVNMFVTVTMAVSREELDVAEGSNAANYEFASQGTDFIVRNNFKQAIVTQDMTMYDVTGFWAIYNETGQLYPTEVKEFVDPIDIMGDVTKYYIQNPSFDVDADGLPLTAEQKASNGPLNIAGWTMTGVGSQFNNTEIRQANSTSTTSAFGTSDPSDGNYLLFFRQGWNRDGVVNEIVLEADAYELPEGQYMISVDYKQAYSYDKAGSKDTKIKLSLELDDLIFGEAETEAAPVGNATYFKDTEWSTLETLVNVDYGDIDLQGSVSPVVKITLYAAGDKRSDFFIDNVRLVRVSEEDISRTYLEQAIEQANKLLEEPYGLLFTKTEDAHNDLESAVEAAEEVLNSEAPTAYDLDEASRQLLIAIETYENSEMIQPDPDALYTIKLKDGGNYMSVSNEGTKLSAEPVGLHFAETDNGYSIANEDASYYAACTGTGSNNWSMGTSSAAYDWIVTALPSGEYTIGKASVPADLIGADNSAAASNCYANKTVVGVGNRAIWIIEEYTAPATVLEGIAALKAFTLDEGVEEADVVLRLTDAKVTFSGVTEQTDIDYETWEEITVEVDNVVMEDATAGNLFQGLKLGNVLKKGDKVSGDIELKVVAGWFGPEYKANDKTAASIEALTIENGEATPLAVTDENVEAYAENFDWIYAAFTDAIYTVSENGDPTLTFPVLGTSYGIMDNLGIFPEGLDLEEGDVVSVEGYIWNYMGMMTIFQPTAIEKAASTMAEVVTVNTARGAWMYDAANNRIHYGTIPESGATDEFKFAFVEKDGEKFLYSIAAQKFVQPQKYLVEGMSTPVNIVDGDGYQMVKAANSNLTINIGGSQFTWDTWTAADDGNKLTIEPVGEFDAADALAMLEQTPIDQHKVFNIITKRGQWAASADGASLGTTDNNPAATEADKQFAFYYDGSKVYIYSVGAKKFIKNDGSFFEAKGDPVDYRLVSTDDYNYCFFFTDNLCYFNMQNNGARYSINTWSTPDDGNREHLAVVEGVDVYDEMDEVFHNVLVDVEYELVYDGKVIGTATGTNVVGKAPQLPAELDNELCSYTYDVETIAEDTKKVVATAEWAGPFEFSTSFDDAKWYNMKIRGDYYIAYDETEPYYPTTDKNIFAPESQWAFLGDPYNVVIVNRALSQSFNLVPENAEETTEDGEPIQWACPLMREDSYAWDIFGNGDGFVLREKGTETNYVNLYGGEGGPLAFWNSASGRRDLGSTITVEEATDALVLSTDVDYYKGQNGLTYEVDFTQALEYLGIESLDEATIAGVDVTTDVEVENYTIFDGWRNANGDYEQWGENAAVCVKFIEEPEQFAIYDMGNDLVPAVGETFVARFHISFDGKMVIYDVNVNFVAPPAKYLADYTEKGSFDITIFAPEKGVAFDGEDSEIFEETTISDLIGAEWGEVYGKGITDEVGETFATVYSCDPEPGFWCLEDGTADVYDNGTFGVSLIPAEDWSTMNFRAWTKEALTDNLSTAFYFVNEETKEYVTYNVTLSAKPAVNLVGEFDGFIKQILSHPQTGKQGEASGDQKVTITEGEEPGTYNVTFSGFTMPVTGAILPEFTITGVETVVDDDGTAALYVLPAWAPQTITIGRGTGSVTYDIQFEGAKEGNDTPILKLTLTNSVVDEVYFGADEKTVDKAIATDEADAISGVRGITTADSVFDLSGRKVEKIQKSGVYIVNGKKVSIK